MMMLMMVMMVMMVIMVMMMVMMMKVSSTWQAASFFMDSVVEVTASLRRAPWPWISIVAILSWCRKRMVQEE